MTDEKDDFKENFTVCLTEVLTKFIPEMVDAVAAWRFGARYKADEHSYGPYVIGARILTHRGFFLGNLELPLVAMEYHSSYEDALEEEGRAYKVPAKAEFKIYTFEDGSKNDT